MENLNAKFHQWFGLSYKLHSSQEGSGPVVVMLHGIATSSASWEHMKPYLNPGFTCVTIDLLGFGESPKPEWNSYTPEEHIKSIHRTINKLRLKKPYMLVGHSMGSLLAVHYAQKYPKEVSRLLVLSPPIYLSKNEMVKARKVWRDTLYAGAYKYIRMHKKFTLKGVRGLKNLALKNNAFHITEETWTAFSRSLEECIEKQNFLHDLEYVNCPVDIFYGTLDQLLIKNNIRKLRIYPKVSLHPIRNGHLVSDKYARYVAEIIAGYTKSIPSESETYS